MDLRDLRVSRSRRVVLPLWADELIASNGGPLLFAGSYEGRRVVVFTFDVTHSNLPLRTAFPVLLGNLYTWLNPYQVTEMAVHYNPGEIVEIVPHPQADRVLVETPTGARIAYVGRQVIPFAETTTPGIYWTFHVAGSQEIYREPFIVSLLSAEESNTQVRTDALPALGNGVPPLTLPLRQELWYVLALLVAFLLLFEWFWYHRVRT